MRSDVVPVDAVPEAQPERGDHQADLQPGGSRDMRYHVRFGDVASLDPELEVSLAVLLHPHFVAARRRATRRTRPRAPTRPTCVHAPRCACRPRRADRTDLDLVPGERFGHVEHRRAHVAADVGHDARRRRSVRARSSDCRGGGVISSRRPAANPLCGVPRYGKPSR